MLGISSGHLDTFTATAKHARKSIHHHLREFASVHCYAINFVYVRMAPDERQRILMFGLLGLIDAAVNDGKGHRITNFQLNKKLTKKEPRSRCLLFGATFVAITNNNNKFSLFMSTRWWIYIAFQTSWTKMCGGEWLLFNALDAHWLKKFIASTSATCLNFGIRTHFADFSFSQTTSRAPTSHFCLSKVCASKSDVIVNEKIEMRIVASESVCSIDEMVIKRDDTCSSLKSIRIVHLAWRVSYDGNDSIRFTKQFFICTCDRHIIVHRRIALLLYCMQLTCQIYWIEIINWSAYCAPRTVPSSVAKT